MLAEFNGIGAQAMSFTNSAITKAWEIGSLLNKAKEEVAHGQWEGFFEKHFQREHFHIRHAQRMMKLAKITDIELIVNDPIKRKQAFIACGLTEEPTLSLEQKPILQTWLGKMKTLWKKGVDNDREQFLHWASSSC